MHVRGKAGVEVAGERRTVLNFKTITSSFKGFDFLDQNRTTSLSHCLLGLYKRCRYCANPSIESGKVALVDQTLMEDTKKLSLDICSQSTR